MSDLNLQQLRELVGVLESGDAFERRDAIERLAVLTQQRLDFRWSADDPERRRAIKRWKRWIAREERERQTKLLAAGKIDKAALDAALQALKPADKKAFMQKVLAKVVAQKESAQALPVCELCERRPATAHVTQRGDDGTYSARRCCEVCAHRSA